jgi:hypothetical protein
VACSSGSFSLEAVEEAGAEGVLEVEAMAGALVASGAEVLEAEEQAAVGDAFLER